MGEPVAEGGLHAEPALEAGGGFEENLGWAIEDAVEADVRHFVDVAEEALLQLLALGGAEVGHEVLHGAEEVVIVVADVGASQMVEYECCTGLFDGDWEVG